MFAAALFRLLTHRTVAPYPLAQADHAIAGFAIAAATGSFVITLAVGLFIAGAIAASFEAPPRLAIALGILWITLQTVTASVIDNRADSAPLAFAIVLIILALALAILILIFFGLQAHTLRRELQRRESQLDAVLAVTPVLLGAVGPSGSIEILAGEFEQVPISSDQLASSHEVADMVADAWRGIRVTREVSISGRVLSVTCDPGVNDALLMTAYDITTQAQARDRLANLVRAKDQFIAAVSHELRTPLSSVLGYAELVNELATVDDPIRSMVGEIVGQSAEMAAIIEDLLVAARSSFEHIPTNPVGLDLAAEVASVGESISSRLTKVPAYDLRSAIAFADPIRVRQIVRNLMTNADRYGGDQLMVLTGTDDGRAYLEVRDSGPPIPGKLQDRIFEPYESSGPIGGQPAAIGLGLTVSRTLADLMDGSVTYRHDGQWSTFELRLPLCNQPQELSAAVS
jgi:signal transduction histidine kinase